VSFDAWDRTLLAAALVSDLGVDGLAGCVRPSVFVVLHTAPDVVLLCVQPMVGDYLIGLYMRSQESRRNSSDESKFRVSASVVKKYTRP